MPMNKRNTRDVARTVYCGMTETVTLLKRGNDQKQGTVTAYRLFRCRKSLVTKTAETIAGEESANHRTIWHIPLNQLELIGIKYLNVLDRIVDKSGAYWQPEATTVITTKLLGNEIDLECLRVDP